MRWLPASVLIVALSGVLSPTRAEAEPGLGYLDAAYALPWHYAFVTSGTTITEHQLQRSFGIGEFSAGLGIGYNGLNGQLDFHNALNLTTGAATIGYRFKFSLIGFEFWLRGGLGPAVVFDGIGGKVRTTGAIATDLEGGIDYFVLSFLALGVKGVATPQLFFPAQDGYRPSFSADFAIEVGFRLAI